MMKDVVLQVSSGTEVMLQGVHELAVMYSDDASIPMSVTTGRSYFPGGTEHMARITFHGVRDETEALCFWHRLRRDDRNGVDCGRIEIGGLSWCAKTLDNKWWSRNTTALSDRWPGQNFEPTEL